MSQCCSKHRPHSSEVQSQDIRLRTPKSAPVSHLSVLGLNVPGYVQGTGSRLDENRGWVRGVVRGKRSEKHKRTHATDEPIQPNRRNHGGPPRNKEPRAERRLPTHRRFKICHRRPDQTPEKVGIKRMDRHRKRRGLQGHNRMDKVEKRESLPEMDEGPQRHAGERRSGQTSRRRGKKTPNARKRTPSPPSRRNGPRNDPGKDRTARLLPDPPRQKENATEMYH